MKNESDVMSQQIKACNADINHLSNKIEDLSGFLHEKEARVAELQSELQAHQQASNTPEQSLGFLKLMTQIAELECKLQEAEYLKQQAELEKEATEQEMKARQTFKAHLHAQLSKLWIVFLCFMCHCLTQINTQGHLFDITPTSVVSIPVQSAFWYSSKLVITRGTMSAGSCV